MGFQSLLNGTSKMYKPSVYILDKEAVNQGCQTQTQSGSKVKTDPCKKIFHQMCQFNMEPKSSSQ